MKDAHRTNKGHHLYPLEEILFLCISAIISGMDEDWPGLKSVAKVISERTDKRSGKKTTETRYYISSLPGRPKVIGHAIRSHWVIENNLHWTLDMVLRKIIRSRRKDTRL